MQAPQTLFPVMSSPWPTCCGPTLGTPSIEVRTHCGLDLWPGDALPGPRMLRRRPLCYHNIPKSETLFFYLYEI